MYEFNLLRHIADQVLVTDQSNVWKNSEILDIPVYTPNSITLPGGIAIYDDLDPFEYAIYDDQTQMVHLLYGLDVKGRYTFLDLAKNYTHFSYKFGGRSFPQMRQGPTLRYEDKTLYIMGGMIEGDPMTDSWSYNFKTKTWSMHKDLPSPRWNHSILFNDDDRIYLFGGLTASRIDGRRLWLNDVFWIDKDMIGEWTLLDREATLPHAEGSLLGTDGTFLYLWIEQRVWSVALVGEQTSGSLDTFDIGHYISDVSVRDDGTYLLSKEDHEDYTGNIYRWTPPYNFELVATDQICIPDNLADSVQIIENPLGIQVNDIRFGGNKPPKLSSAMSHCKFNGGDAFYGGNILHIFHHDSFNTVQYELDELPRKCYISYQQKTQYIWLVGWNPEQELIVARFDLDSLDHEIMSSTKDELLYREGPSVTVVQQDLWLLGGSTLADGAFADQWRFNLNDLQWTQEITLEPLPEQPFRTFEWRERLWLIPHTIASLYRYYPSMRQWTPVYLSREDTVKQNLGLMDDAVKWDVVDNRLFIEPKGYNNSVIELEPRVILDPLYNGDLWLAIDYTMVIYG